MPLGSQEHPQMVKRPRYYTKGFDVFKWVKVEGKECLLNGQLTSLVKQMVH